MKTIEIIVIVATLLGGLAAVVYFWDKIVALFRRTRARQTLPQFAPGRWRSMGATNELVIENDLSWSWTSTHQGHWRGSGRGDVRDVYLVLHGTREGKDPLGRPVPPYPITIQLERQGDRLEGSIQAMLKSDVIFVRDETTRPGS
jgi:hypothetical protein